MSEELTGQVTPVVDNEAATPAPTPEEKVETPPADAATEQAEQSAETKTFTQEQLDEIVKKEKAKAEAKAERRVLKSLEKLSPQPQQPVYQQQPVDDRPRRDQFASEESFIEALTDWKLESRDRAAREEQLKAQSREQLSRTESLYKEAEKLPGFDRDDFEQLPLTPVIAQVIYESDQAPKLMAYMASNPEEVSRIANLSPARQAAELGKLETKLASQPAVKPSKAPAPINPVGAASKAPSKLESLSVDDYIAERRKQKPVWAR